MMHRYGAAAIAAVGTSIASTASAAEPAAVPKFGRAGTVVLADVVGARTSLKAEPHLDGLGLGGTGPSAAWLSITTAKTDIGSERMTLVTFAPSFDVFVAPLVSVGGLVGFDVMNGPGDNSESPCPWIPASAWLFRCPTPSACGRKPPSAGA